MGFRWVGDREIQHVHTLDIVCKAVAVHLQCVVHIFLRTHVTIILLKNRPLIWEGITIQP